MSVDSGIPETNPPRPRHNSSDEEGEVVWQIVKAIQNARAGQTQITIRDSCVVEIRASEAVRSVKSHSASIGDPSVETGFGEWALQKERGEDPMALGQGCLVHGANHILAFGQGNTPRGGGHVELRESERRGRN